MNASRLRLAAAALTLGAALPCLAVDVGGVSVGDEARVGGHNLTLNGAGIGMKAMVFKVYVIGLYLPARKRSMAEITAAEGPRRIMISMLRQVSVADFRDHVAAAIEEESKSPQPEGFIDQLNRLSEAMAKSGRGLQRGDTLTLDWVPGQGTVIELNEQAIAEPVPGVDFYNALLGVWLGEKPTDRALKPKLLGDGQLL